MFQEWIQGRRINVLSTNSGASELPFQGWRNFKEAFTPELVARAISESPIDVRSSFDPFGGSGTTALTSQFLGVRPTTIEVNPFLADLIAAKLQSYDADALARDLGSILRNASSRKNLTLELLSRLPPTFVQPGVAGRWLFDYDIAHRIMDFRASIDCLDNLSHRRLFRVLLGGLLVEVCNAITSGKGRRYRSGWEVRPRSARQVDDLFCKSAENAVSEIYKYSSRKCRESVTLQGDCRLLAGDVKSDIVVFSPPYPNSFDYTDVYNLELWMLGYLFDKTSNRRLRASTLTSHVQLLRQYSPAPTESAILQRTLRQLESSRSELWSRWIPEMIGAYFADMRQVLSAIACGMTSGGTAWIVTGDSRYAEANVPTARIIVELLEPPWRLIHLEPFRSMRSSPQQGGREDLEETLIVLRKS